MVGLCEQVQDQEGRLRQCWVPVTPPAAHIYTLVSQFHFSFARRPSGAVLVSVKWLYQLLAGMIDSCSVSCCSCEYSDPLN